MKQLFNKFLTAVIFSSLLISCKKDLEKTTIQPPVAPILSLSPVAVILSAANAADTVETISFIASKYGFSAAVNYTIQVAKAGTNFVSPKEINLGSKTQLKFSGADLNQLALLRGLPPGSAGSLEIRVKSSLSDSLIIYSDKVTLTVTPYLVIINYPSLWVPGDYQGWDPGKAPKISSKSGNGVYEGYVNITPGSLQFKYTSDADWNHTTYGWASSTTSGNNVSGTFNTSGGNLFVPVAGYYLLKGNTTANTWSGTIINTWSLIGDFNSYNGDVDMTYNAAAKLWTGTISPAANGAFKFRANHDWAINFGDDGGDLILDYNGANLPVTAGSHLITLDLSAPGNYTYKVQ